MAKTFYTEREIDDLVKRGVTSLEITDDVVLTVLAYERANRHGLALVQKHPENLPGAPVRPYISLVPQSKPVSLTSTQSVPAPTALPALPAAPQAANPESDLHKRIYSAVIARLGSQIEPTLLDAIIRRVLVTTGLK